MQGLRVVIRVLIVVVAIAFLFWFYQKIDANFERQALIETKQFGALREELDEDFSGEELAGIDGPVMIYGYSKRQDLDLLSYDEVSDHTLVDPRTGRERQLSGDDRKVVWFDPVNREIARPDPKEGEPASEQRAFAYVARLATRQMYLDGTSDLVIGNLATLEQREIAKDVSFVDAVAKGEGENEVAILLWNGPEKPRHIVVDVRTLDVISARDITLPEASSFALDGVARERETHGKPAAPEMSVPVPVERPRQRPRPQRPPK